MSDERADQNDPEFTWQVGQPTGGMVQVTDDKGSLVYEERTTDADDGNLVIPRGIFEPGRTYTVELWSHPGGVKLVEQSIRLADQ